jgi:hypothetical protein
VVFPVVCQSFVEISVFLLGDIFGLSHPNWLDFVENFVFVGDFLDLLLFLVLLFGVILDLGFIGVLLLVVFLFIVV